MEKRNLSLHFVVNSVVSFSFGFLFGFRFPVLSLNLSTSFSFVVFTVAFIEFSAGDIMPGISPKVRNK
jgi:hypothetical protein